MSEASDIQGLPKFLTEAQAASLVGVDKQTIRRLIDKKLLVATDYGVGKRHFYRIHPDDLRQVQRNATPPVVTPLMPLVRGRRPSSASSTYQPFSPPAARAKAVA